MIGMSAERLPPFPFLANARWLDFVNTEPATGGRSVDLIADFAALVRWGREAGLLTSAEAGKVARSPAAAQAAALEAARRLRTGLRDAAAELAAAPPPRATVVAEVNRLLAAHPTVASLKRDAAGAWTLRTEPAALSPGTLPARIAADFARWLAGGAPGLLRQCARPDCVLYFLDTSKNHSRRWCSMDTCGNRTKAAGRRARARA